MDLQVTTRGFRTRKNMVEMKIGPPLPKRFKERSLLATGNEARRRQMSTTISQGWPDVVEGEKNKRTIEVDSRETSQHNKERKKERHTSRLSCVQRKKRDSDGETTKRNHRDACNHQNKKGFASCLLPFFFSLSLFLFVWPPSSFCDGDGQG
jgi:hypothetical protein